MMSKYKKLVESIQKSCETTIECNERIMEEHFKGYDGRYYDQEREEYTMLEIEIEQAEAVLRQINDALNQQPT
jgi:ASC-1-like (ASCH) protein